MGCVGKDSSKNFYSKEEIANTVQRLTKEEFNLAVVTSLVDNCLWVYFPVDKLLDNDLNLSEGVGKNLDHIGLIIARVILNSPNPPEFYALAISDIKTLGADYITIIYSKDLKRFYYSRISRGDFLKRRVSQFKPNPMALNELNGNHIQKGGISLPKFLAEQIGQRIEIKFKEPNLKTFLTVKSIGADFQDGRFIFRIEIDKINPVFNLDIIQEALKIISSVLKDYNFKDFSEVEINESATSKNTTINQKALFEDF